MTPNDNQPNANGARGVTHAGDVDKILDHNRLQLSALIDGELPLDEARFLLRRLEHDAELAGCWERWQVCGDVLRGRAGALLPGGFAERVAAAVASDHGSARATSSSGGRRWLQWSGSAALAASVAVIALLLVRQSPDAKAPAVPTEQIAATTPSTAAATPSATTLPSPGPDHQVPDRLPEQSTQWVSAVAVADVPRRMATRRSRGQSQRAAKRSPTRAPVEAPVAVAASGAAAPTDPFSNVSLSNPALPNRPWPRALLPGSHASGAFTVDYGNQGARSPSFYPFAPRTVPVAPAEESSAEDDSP